MARLELKIGFNGEQQNFFNNVTNYEYFEEKNPSNLISSVYFDGQTGELPTGKKNNVPSITINKIKDLNVIRFELKYDLASSPCCLKLGTRYVRYYNKDGSSFILLDSDYWSVTQKDSNTLIYEYRLKSAIEYAVLTSDAEEPIEDSYVVIRFTNVIRSTETEYYSYGYINIVFQDNTSYLSYTNDSFEDLTFIKKIESEKYPIFGFNQSDGDVNIIDKNLYIQERLKTKEIKNYFITKVLYNGNLLGKFVGVRGKYPYSSKTLSYDLDDYISLMLNKPMSDFYIQKKLNGYELFSELAKISFEKSKVRFAQLNQNYIDYLKKFTFYDPYIKCNNLKGLWETFLNTTLCTLYINNFGYLQLNSILLANQDIPIIVTKDKVEQDIDLNLIADNAINYINVNSKTYSQELYEKNRIELGITSGKVSTDDYSLTNQFYLTKTLSDYIDWINDDNSGEYIVNEPSLYYKFLDYKKVEKIKTITAYGSTKDRTVTEESILAESFVDFGEDLYKTLQANFIPKLTIGYGAGEEENNVKYLYNNFIYKYNIVWLNESDYDLLNLSIMDLDTLYFNKESKFTTTGRVFKSVIPISHMVQTGLTTSNVTPYFFNGFNMYLNSNKRLNSIYSYGENEIFKSEFTIEDNSLIYTEIDDKPIELIFETFSDLMSYDRSELVDRTLALVQVDETNDNEQTVYISIVANQINMWTFLRKDKTTRYDNQPVSFFIAETLQKLYNNGRQSITFTTSVYDFLNDDGIIVCKAQNGDILKVGDLIKLPSVSNKNFKIISISSTYQGVLNLKVVAIEMN